ncbi:MAG: type II toxin-antitoxin system Phd/YefM family antitoxin [Proteobacteria bacterium]|nr:type II toxin-antitoxin system Phd/YefM family antitoxin [Pseudomonadota bacterium]
MEEINALTLRNNLGAILDRLTDSGEPVIIRKKNKIKAVLITPEQFEKRFLDWQTDHEKKRFLDALTQLKRRKKGQVSSLDHLRSLRGYKE